MVSVTPSSEAVTSLPAALRARLCQALWAVLKPGIRTPPAPVTTLPLATTLLLTISCQPPSKVNFSLYGAPASPCCCRTPSWA